MLVVVTTDALLVVSYKHKQKRIAPLDNQHMQIQGVCKQWTGLLDWTTGLTFDLKFNHEIGHACQINSYK